MATIQTEAVIISGPRRGDLITLDESGTELLPEQILPALREFNAALDGALREAQLLREALASRAVPREQSNA
ncbi:MAG: hypothetical protein HY318_17930 [Armatimonadetes bacterium]|nr:hypothetical protein [Armatimonadota bacterium]